MHHRLVEYRRAQDLGLKNTTATPFGSALAFLIRGGGMRFPGGALEMVGC